MAISHLMPAPRSAPIVERRPLAARRYAARPDDLAEVRLVIATMRDLPRGALESFPDIIHLLRRLSGRLAAVADRLEVQQEPKPPRTPRTRLTGRPAADPAAIAAAVFKDQPRKTPPRREKSRTVMSRKGKLVRVVERPPAQLELTV